LPRGRKVVGVRSRDEPVEGRVVQPYADLLPLLLARFQPVAGGHEFVEFGGDSGLFGSGRKWNQTIPELGVVDRRVSDAGHCRLNIADEITAPQIVEDES